MIKNKIIFIWLTNLLNQLIKWGLGIGDWGLGIGDWGLGPIPNPQSPIPNNYFKIIKKNIYLNNIILRRI